MREMKVGVGRRTRKEKEKNNKIEKQREKKGKNERDEGGGGKEGGSEGAKVRRIPFASALNPPRSPGSKGNTSLKIATPHLQSIIYVFAFTPS